MRSPGPAGKQAPALGGTLLLPPPLLARAAKAGEIPESIAGLLGVTTEMARFRFNSTGVAKQVAAGRTS